MTYPISPFKSSFQLLCYEIHENAKQKGWWDEPRSVGDCIALMHSELSEALEEYRKHGTVHTSYIEENGKPEGFIIELADVMIRIIDFCEFHKIDIYSAMIQKHEYNRSRPYRHGGKKL